MPKAPDLGQAILEQASRGRSTGKPPVAEGPPPPSAATKPRGLRQASRVGKASVTGYFRPEVRRQLRRLAADSDATIQALLAEALNDLFAKHGLPEIAHLD